MHKHCLRADIFSVGYNILAAVSDLLHGRRCTATLKHRCISSATASAYVEGIAKSKPIEGVRLSCRRTVATGWQHESSVSGALPLRRGMGFAASHAADLALPNVARCASMRPELVKQGSLQQMITMCAFH